METLVPSISCHTDPLAWVAGRLQPVSANKSSAVAIVLVGAMQRAMRIPAYTTLCTLQEALAACTDRDELAEGGCDLRDALQRASVRLGLREEAKRDESQRADLLLQVVVVLTSLAFIVPSGVLLMLRAEALSHVAAAVDRMLPDGAETDPRTGFAVTDAGLSLFYSVFGRGQGHADSSCYQGAMKLLMSTRKLQERVNALAGAALAAPRALLK